MKTDHRVKQSLLPGFNIAPMDDLTLFLISEDELEQFARGTSESPLLTFGVGLLSVGCSFGAALLTVKELATPLLIFYWVATLVGLLNGTALLIIWLWKRRFSVTLAQRIRLRRPPSGDPLVIVEGAEAAVQAPTATPDSP